jgi:PucR family transcriptional regulator, purine catabolism regulatory protein
MQTARSFVDSADFDRNKKNGQLISNSQNRSIVVDVHAFGSFRKDLIHNIGLERTMGFMFRYGWNMGIQDAKECKEKELYQTIEELIEYGPILHSNKGYVESKTIKILIGNENNVFSLQMESAWEDSFEANEHLDQIGISSSPVCYSLSGYASGFVTEACGQKIIFKEICCRGSGSSECMAVGKSEFLWGNEIKNELYYLEAPPF